MKKYVCKTGKTNSLAIWPKNNNQLFNIGCTCVYIYKKSISSSSNCLQNSDSTYEFNGTMTVEDMESILGYEI